MPSGRGFRGRAAAPGAQDLLHVVSCEGRRDGQKDLQVAELLAQTQRRRPHDPQMGAELVPAAPGEQRHGRPHRIEPQGAERLIPGEHRMDEIQERVADELHRNTRLPVDLLFERQDHQHPIDRPGDLLHPTLAPGPDLRADEIEDRHPGIPGMRRQAQVEVGIID